MALCHWRRGSLTVGLIDGSNVHSSPGSTTLNAPSVIRPPSIKAGRLRRRTKRPEERDSFSCIDAPPRVAAPTSDLRATTTSGRCCARDADAAESGSIVLVCSATRSELAFGTSGRRKITASRKSTRNIRCVGYTSIHVRRLGIGRVCIRRGSVSILFLD